MEIRWRIEMFGGLRVHSDAGESARAGTQKTGPLLAYLAYPRPSAHPREALIELLWPECDPAAGRNRLNVALNWLRRRLEPPGMAPGSVLRTDRSTVQLNPAAVTTDVEEFEAALHEAALTP